MNLARVLFKRVLGRVMRLVSKEKEVYTIAEVAALTDFPRQTVTPTLFAVRSLPEERMHGQASQASMTFMQIL